MAGVRVVNPQRLDQLSPSQDRLDVKSEMLSGFPYKLKHADVLAGLLAQLSRCRVPKKGLITDLDDTLWSGLVGEAGPRWVSWSLEHHSQVHGLYQQLLASLAEAGVLLAVASKNDEAAVEEAFRRVDLILSREHVFPFEVHWSPKSESVGRILRRWNVGADSVVFVDDSPLELAEVKAVHPEIECLLFNRKDEQAVYDLLVQLRDLFGKDRISEEDAIRSESLRRSEVPPIDGGEPPESAYDAFLAGAGAVLKVSFKKSADDPRALELINKTNQFNLNGRRFTEGAWRARLGESDTFLLTATYADKFGPLGKVAIVSGRARGKTPSLDVWVMSCRAFSRKIEYACLGLLFREFGADAIVLDFVATPKNGPMQEFLAKFHPGPPGAGVRLTREAFEASSLPLHLAIQGLPDD
jgi:FkbH-like protein